MDRAKEFWKLVPKPKAKAQAKTPSVACPRFANVHDLQGWDHAWQITFDFGLQVFVASSPCVPLPEGTRRFWVSVDILPPALRDAAAGRVRRGHVARAPRACLSGLRRHLDDAQGQVPCAVPPVGPGKEV